MNHLRIIFILITFSVSAALYATPFEQELAQLQEQRAKALATASDPINRRYAVSLEQLLRRATQANDLDSAIKVKAALADIAAVVSSTTSSAAQTARLSIRSLRRPTLFVQHSDSVGWLLPISTDTDRANATFERLPGVAGKDYVSFRSPFSPAGVFVGHSDFRIKLRPLEDTDESRKGRSFKQHSGLADSNGVSFESVDYPDFFIRAKGDKLYIQKKESTSAFRDDATFVIVEPQSRK